MSSVPKWTVEFEDTQRGWKRARVMLYEGIPYPATGEGKDEQAALQALVFNLLDRLDDVERAKDAIRNFLGVSTR